MIAAAIARVESCATDEDKAVKYERRRRKSKDLLDTTTLSWDHIDVENVDDNADTPVGLRKEHAQLSVKPQFRDEVVLQPSRASEEISIVRQNLQGMHLATPRN